MVTTELTQHPNGTPFGPSNGPSKTTEYKDSGLEGVYLLKDLIERPDTRQSWVIDDVIPEEAIGMLSGAPKIGKTFAVVDMAMSVACGRSWFGKEVKQGPVYWLCGEAPKDLRARMFAWCCSKEGVRYEDLPVFIDLAPYSLNQSSDVEALGRRIQASLGGEAPSLIVVDTLHQYAAMVDENTSELGHVFHHMSRFKRGGSTVLFVHHTARTQETSGRPRGHSSIEGDSDFILTAKRDTKRKASPLQVEVWQLRQGESGEKFSLPLRPACTDTGESTLVIDATQQKPKQRAREDELYELTVPNKTYSIEELTKLHNENGTGKQMSEDSVQKYARALVKKELFQRERSGRRILYSRAGGGI